MGLGLHGGGAGVAKFFCKQGAKVTVTDLKSKERLKESLYKLRGYKIEYVLGEHRPKEFSAADLIIKNPDVPGNSPFLKIARGHKIPVETDINLFFKLTSAPIIGITGTKGKSTVATLIYLLLKDKYKNTILAGNIGVSPLEYLSKINKRTKVVLELSSFALENLKTSPKVAVITNIYPDHLNRYKNLSDYIDAKKRVFKYQTKRDILILNYDNLVTRGFSKNALSRVYFYSTKTLPKKNQKKNFSCFLKKNEIFFGKETKLIYDARKIKLYGEHNLSNILAAVSVAKLLKVPTQNIQIVLQKFKGIPWRQEFIKENRGVKYFNDTAATMPESAIEAIKTFSQRFPESKIILIAGGVNKKLEYRNLAAEIKDRINYLVLLPGTASDKIKEGLEILNSNIPVSSVDSVEKAVKIASKIAQDGDIVLLSPGAASFNLFKNEFDRGEKFNKAVKALK